MTWPPPPSALVAWTEYCPAGRVASSAESRLPTGGSRFAALDPIQNRGDFAHTKANIRI
jgi:hypothetical protein